MHWFLERARRALPTLLVLGVLAAVAWHARDVDWAGVATALAAISPARVAAGVALTVLSYVVLAAYDPVAWRAFPAAKRPGTRRALVSGFTGYAVSHTVGWSALSGGAVRHRFYARRGHALADVARVQAQCIVTTGLGYALLAALALATAPTWWPAWAPGAPARVQALAALPTLALTAFLAWSARGGPALAWRERVLFTPPAPRVAGAQVVLGSLHWLFTAAVPFALLAPPMPFPAFVGVFLVAQVAIIASRVPAGLGVLEGVMVLAFAGAVAAPVVIGALLAYRALYHALPFVAGLGVLAADAWRGKREAV